LIGCAFLPEAALVHQRHHLVRGIGGFHPDLAAGALLELGDPVEVLVGLAALDIAGPGDDIHPALALADLLQHLLRERRAAAEQERDGRRARQAANDDCHTGSLLHGVASEAVKPAPANESSMFGTVRSIFSGIPRAADFARQCRAMSRCRSPAPGNDEDR